MKKSLLWLLMMILSVSMIATFSLVGCKEEGAEGAGSEAKEVSFGLKEFEPEGGLQFAFATISTEVAFWVPTVNALNDFAAQYGVEADHVGPADYDPIEEAAILENLLEAGIDGVNILIPEPGIMDSVVKKYLDEGIPVTVSFIGFEDAERLGLPYVGQQYDEVGTEWGEKIVEVLGGPEEAKGKQVLFLTESPGSSVLEGRMNSAKEILDEAGVIHSTIDTTTDREKAYSNIESAYTANPEIVGFFSTDTTGTPAAGLFVKNNNLTGKVVVGGFDLNPDTLTGIKEGYIEFTIDQYPYRALHLAMTMLYEKIVLGLEPYTEYMPAGFVDKSNVDSAIELSGEGYR